MATNASSAAAVSPTPFSAAVFDDEHPGCVDQLKPSQPVPLIRNSGLTVGEAPQQAGEAPPAKTGDDAEPRDPQLDAYDKQRAVTLEKGDFASWTALISVAERLVRSIAAHSPPGPRALVRRLPLSHLTLCLKPPQRHQPSRHGELTLLISRRTTRRG